MDKEHVVKDLRGFAEQIRDWDREDINKMYELMVLVNRIKRVLKDDALFTSIVQPENLPVGSSPAPADRTNVWTWDNHGRYLIGEDWTEEKLKIRRLNELNIK